ncbi:MAG: hypothetical protein OEQ47_05235 [Acidimicrobiia bacterium]|nr:hypothetical protein [Acidimicrobiia bacterium]
MTRLQTEYTEIRQRRLFQVKMLFIIAGFLSFLLSVFLYFLVDEQQGIYVENKPGTPV